jgi:cytochrome o ubiquinol oxidase subunit IV
MRTLLSYLIGFILSVLLTLLAYFTVVQKFLTDSDLIIFALAALALIQAWIQLTFFLHLGAEAKSSWKSSLLMFTIIGMVILIFGSLWIMRNLNYMHSQDIDKYIQDEEAIHK